MDVSGDVADLMVKESIQLTEASIKLLAAGSKNLAAFLWALAKDSKKVTGKTNLGRLLKEGRELKVFRIKESDIKTFGAFSKQYGVLFAGIKDKRREDGMIDLISSVDYAAQVNHILERLGYPAPVRTQEVDTSKKADPRAQPVSSSPGRGSGLTAELTRTGRTTRTPDGEGKPSVKGRLAALRAASEGMSGKVPQRTRATPPKTR